MSVLDRRIIELSCSEHKLLHKVLFKQEKKSIKTGYSLKKGSENFLQH